MRITLSTFLNGQLEGLPGAVALGMMLGDVAAAVRAISATSARGALCAAPPAVPTIPQRGRFTLLFEPPTDPDLCIGTLFSVLRDDGALAAAGYALCGPATLLVLSVGRGTHGLTLDREHGAFVLTHPSLAIPEDGGACAIDAGHSLSHEPALQRYVAECRADGRPLRWEGSAVAELHRILLRGGVLVDTLLLVPQAQPLAMLVEQAGGLASTGQARLLDLPPGPVAQQVPVVLGARREVERIERYHLEHQRGEDHPYVSPLFNERSLYRPEALV